MNDFTGVFEWLQSKATDLYPKTKVGNAWLVGKERTLPI